MAFIVPEGKRLVNVGDRFGRLKVDGVPFQASDGNQNRRRQSVVCLCDCGERKVMQVSVLRKGHAISCGCFRTENPPNKTHGGSYSALFMRWVGMKSRCYKKTDRSFHRYGGRGIAVCDKWIDDFAAFREWSMSSGFRPELELDRKDNDGPYSPGNCRWVMPVENARNRSTSRMLSAFGETKPVAAWAEDSRCSVSADTLHKRLSYGWSHEEAISLPANTKRIKDDKSKQNDCDGIADV